jgi:glycosyltransferase involved in cell wall biosynthesis
VGQRITIVTGAFLPASSFAIGAVEKMWCRLAIEFARSGRTVTLVSRRFPGLADDEIVAGVHHVRLSGFSRTGRLGLDLFLDLCYTLLVLPHLPKSEYTVTNTFFLPILTSLRPERFGKTIVDLARFPKGQLPLYSKSSCIRAPSKPVLNEAVRQCPSLSSRLRTIPNPIDTVIFRPPISSRRRPGNKTILYTGRIHPEKGLHILIGALRLLNADFPDVSLTMIGTQETAAGGGGAEYVSRLQTLARGIPVTLKPPIGNPEQLATELQNADIFCYPSTADKGETFGIAPLEAMATGLPVVVSKLQVFTDFISDCETGMIFDHQAENPEQQLASKLRMLLVDDDLREKLGSRAATKAIEFSYEKIAEIMLHEFAADS